MLANVLEGVLQGDIKRLIIEIPPRHSKSVHVSELLPAFALGHNPALRLILASYASSLATSFSRKVRNSIRSPEYQKLFPDTRLASDSRSAAMWDLSGEKGGMIAAGVGSGITGHGADLLIIDDPTKDRAAADSATQRQAVWDWYISTARTRLEPDGAVIICQTRWHHDDLAGRLLAGMDEEDKEEWVEVKFPAIANEDDDPLGREIGDPLWPERYDSEALRAIKAEIGVRDWISLYQQNPSDEEGAIFPLSAWKFYDENLFDFNRRFRTFAMWDTAFKDKESNDWSVCATWTRGPDGVCYLRDIRRWRVQFPELKRIFRAQYALWTPDTIWIEDKASGISLFQEFQSTGLPVRTFDPGPYGDKVARANSVTPYVENGRMLLPEFHPLLADFLDEHSKFPAGAHDDMVDTTSMAGILLARTSEIIPQVEMAQKESRW